MNHAYTKYYLTQTGHGLNDIGPLLHYQRGRGIGSFFGGLYKYLKPVLMSGLDIFKKEALNTGIGMLSDIATGASPKETFKNRSVEGLKNIRRDAVTKLNSMYGSGTHRKSIKRNKINNFIQLRPKRIEHKVKHKTIKKNRSRKTKNKIKKRILDIFA